MKKAFTIVEILVVLAVLSVLIGVSIPRIKAMQDNSFTAKARKELAATLRPAIEAYKIHNSNAYPAPGGNYTATIAGTYLNNSAIRFISNIPYDPFGATATTEYGYRVSSNGLYWVVWSIGRNKISETTAISTTGVVTTGGDDICETNGSGCTVKSNLDNGCGTGQTKCNGVCVNLNTSQTNCGSCGNNCGGNACCSGSCVDLNTNNSNCGSCGHGYFTCCIGGSGSNPDLTSDDNNCGSCGSVCSGYTSDCCNSTCVDPNTYQTDNNNCGSCGSTCSGYTPTCVGGSCGSCSTIHYSGWPFGDSDWAYQGTYNGQSYYFYGGWNMYYDGAGQWITSTALGNPNNSGAYMSSSSLLGSNVWSGNTGWGGNPNVGTTTCI